MKLHARAPKRSIDMTAGRPARVLFMFALPMMAGNILQQLYNLVDTAVAGNLLGQAAVAQLGVTSAVFALLTNFAFGLNSGLSLVVSRHFGAGDRDGLQKTVRWTIALSMMTGILLAIVFTALRRPIMVLLKTPQDVMDGALSYISVIYIGIPLSMAYNLESGLLRAVGNSFAPLIFLLIASIAHVALDFLFISGMGMGVEGAALATVISQGLSALIGLFYILRRHPELCIRKGGGYAGRAFVLNLFWTGMSMALMSSILNIGSVVLQGSINALGSIYIAAQSSGRRLAEMFYTAGFAIATATATFASQNLGANQPRRIISGIKAAFALYMIMWTLALISVFPLGRPIMRLITGSESGPVIDNALFYLRTNVPCVPPMAMLVILRNALQGMQHKIAPLMTSVIELAAKLVFALFIVPVWGFAAVCACEPIVWIICCAFILIAALRCRDEFAGTENKDLSR